MNVLKVLVALLVVFLVVGYLELRSPASVADLNRVIAAAKQTPETDALVRKWLVKHPTPTTNELLDLDREVNQGLLLATSRAVTGNPALQSPAPAGIEATAAVKPTVSQSDVVIAWGVKLLLVVLMLAVLVNFPRILRHMRDGR